jgi:uncharacterized BrkB/YihY/UPF0761 family membrane protein
MSTVVDAGTSGRAGRTGRSRGGRTGNDLLWVAATWLLALCVQKSGAFGALYGPLTAFIALPLWANPTAVALFLGIAFAAQLEAARAGIEAAVHPDPGPGP